MFPSLVNCYTIDIWFNLVWPWPADALDAVASTFLAEVEMEKHNRQSVVETCKSFHESVRMLAAKFQSSERRLVYVTPTAYLELMQVFQTLLAKKRQEIKLVHNHDDNGLEQQRMAGDAVTKIKDPNDQTRLSKLICEICRRCCVLI
jgi:dynein heavy chain, axonemal